MTSALQSRRPLQAIIPLSLVGLALQWATWPVLKGMALQWEDSPDYSHGWLVPVLAILILWSRRSLTGDTTLATAGKLLIGLAVAGWMTGSIETREWVCAASVGSFVVGSAILIVEWAGQAQATPSWLGLVLLLVGAFLQLSGAYFYYEWFDRLAIVPLVAGCVLLICGRKIFWWALPAIAFLVFMVPLPYRLEIALRDPLKSIGTSISTYLLQTLGMPAFAEGFVISIGEAKIGVVEACSGLRMLTVFIALSAALVLIVDRPWWHKILLLFSALPIALLANILRITVTGMCYANGWDHLADFTFHDLAGWMMMPIGILLLLAELWFLDHLIVTEVDRPFVTGLTPAGATPAK